MKKTISLKREKLGECGHLEVRWRKCFKQERLWTTSKSDHSSNKSRNDDHWLDCDGEAINDVDNSYGILCFPVLLYYQFSITSSEIVVYFSTINSPLLFKIRDETLLSIGLFIPTHHTLNMDSPFILYLTDLCYWGEKFNWNVFLGGISYGAKQIIIEYRNILIFLFFSYFFFN